MNCQHLYTNNTKNYQKGEKYKTRLRKPNENYCYKHKSYHEN